MQPLPHGLPCPTPLGWDGRRKLCLQLWCTHTPTHEGKHVWLKAALCSSDPRPSVYQLSSGVNQSMLNVCCGAFHTFLCLVSKLVLTWEIWSLALLCFSLFLTHVYTHTNILPNRQERALQDNYKRDTRIINLFCCIAAHHHCAQLSHTPYLCLGIQMTLYSIQHFSCFHRQNANKSILVCWVLSWVFCLPYFLSSLVWVDLG